jgi:hypothetical protein
MKLIDNEYYFLKDKNGFVYVGQCEINHFDYDNPENVTIYFRVTGSEFAYYENELIVLSHIKNPYK